MLPSRPPKKNYMNSIVTKHTVPADHRTAFVDAPPTATSSPPPSPVVGWLLDPCVVVLPSPPPSPVVGWLPDPSVVVRPLVVGGALVVGAVVVLAAALVVGCLLGLVVWEAAVVSDG